jgi:hypothetical protein
VRHSRLCGRLLAVVVLVSLVANGVAASAANGWVLLNPPPSVPSPRASAAMAFDERANRTILYGGITDNLVNSSGETWAYDAGSNTWALRTPSGNFAPAGQYGPSMVYDSRADRVVLFGGASYHPGWMNETWAYDYDLNTWTRLDPLLSPPGRTGFSMVYDSPADRIIAFGGTGVGGALMLSDTWVYDYNNDTWTNATSSTGPSRRTGTMMTYDSKADRVLMYGGVGDFGDLHDTWAFDLNSSTWRLTNPSGNPFAIRDSVMVYDSQVDRTILFGGGCRGGSSGGSTATWAFDYDANNWSRMYTPTAPPCQEQSGLVYDSGSDELIMFGGTCSLVSCTSVGNDATWAYHYGTPAPPGVPTPGLVSIFALVLAVVGAGVVVGVAAWAVERKRGRARP